MKETITHAVKYLVLGILVTAAGIALITFCLAIPDILSFVSDYIGTFTTWIIYLFLVGAAIAICSSERRF